MRLLGSRNVIGYVTIRLPGVDLKPFLTSTDQLNNKAKI